jgi:hypothetical protein
MAARAIRNVAALRTETKVNNDTPTPETFAANPEREQAAPQALPERPPRELSNYPGIVRLGYIGGHITVFIFLVFYTSFSSSADQDEFISGAVKIMGGMGIPSLDDHSPSKPWEKHVVASLLVRSLRKPVRHLSLHRRTSKLRAEQALRYGRRRNHCCYGCPYHHLHCPPHIRMTT